MISEHLTGDSLRARCDFFVETQVWPLEKHLDVAGWLSNFPAAELPYAECLLSAFQYFSQELTVELFKAAFNRLTQHCLDFTPGSKSYRDQWLAFRDDVIVTLVTGETPNPTDSGFTFLRHARHKLGIPEEQIATNEDTINLIEANSAPVVVFVDDFVGSGDQFIDTWIRPHKTASGAYHSFDSLALKSSTRFYYCPAICTWKGYEQIKQNAAAVILSPGNYLTPSYSVCSHNTPIWTDALRPGALTFIDNASRRAGISKNVRGHKGLGLLLAFEDCIPDATIPLLHHETASWHPLVRLK